MISAGDVFVSNMAAGDKAGFSPSALENDWSLDRYLIGDKRQEI
jgi:hypothetical protein